MITLRNISKTFHAGTPDQVNAIRSADLEIARHDFVTIIGTNGSGKSTLLNLVAGNILPDEGRIIIDGHDVTGWSDYRRASVIARVFQNPYMGTAPGMTIAENLLLAWNRGKPHLPKITLNKAFREILRKQLATLDMQLETRLDNLMGTLSGGQRQAVTLLMAVLQTPKVLLLDEHTAALDPKSAAQVIRLTRRFVNEHRLTVVMVTHSMQQALENGNRIIMMHGGRIIEDIPGGEKEKLTISDLLAKFEHIRKLEKLTPQMTEYFTSQYL